MKTRESFVGQPIRSLQTMLRTISEHDSRQPSLVPDGVYGPDTVRAVTSFQRNAGLPVTGVADQVTWDAIAAAYEPALVITDEAWPIQTVFNAGQVIRRGQRHPNVYLAQAMLIVLSELHLSISQPGMTGVLDLPTAQSLSSFQELSLLPVTGELDKITWKHLASQYPLAANHTESQNRRTTRGDNR